MILDDDEVHTHLCPVPGPQRASGFPFLHDDRAICFDEAIRSAGQAQAVRSERDPIKRNRLAAAQAAALPHSFRVTAPTTARERGSDIIDLQDFAGHADPRTTLTYIRSRDR